jgi:hypothetical protein
MLGMLWLREALTVNAPRTFAAALIVATVAFAIPRALGIYYTVVANPQLPLIATLSSDERKLVDWVKSNTPITATIVVEPTAETDQSMRWLSFERFVGRPTLVNFKFVPSNKIDIVRWYRLIKGREALFAGDCSRLAEFKPAYLVSVSAAGREKISRCGERAWSSGTIAVIRLPQ